MHELLKRLLHEVLRVPPEPQPPAGSAESIRIFRASRNYYRYSLLRWGLKQVGGIAGIFFLIAMNSAFDLESRIPWDRVTGGRAADSAETAGAPERDAAPAIVSWLAGNRLLLMIEMIGLAALIVQAPVTYMMVRLDYEMRWYIVTDRSLRIREGVASIREMTMTFANVQNLSIEQGPIQRLLRISDLRVRTAGGGSGDEDKEHGDKEHSMHVGYLRGVDQAEKIRDSILARLRRLKDSGLGDLDDASAAHVPAPASGAGLLPAAREVLGECRALRRALDASP
jgi:membrane protein YdbS with pleckstrin-like domain